MPISLAASSQTQIGSVPSSNFRQRLSQSIIGTKQLKVEGTDSGPPFFIQTRNRAGCSPSLVQEVGLRIRSFSGQIPLEIRGVLPIGRNWASKHLAKIPLKLAKEFGRPEPFNFPTCAMLCTFAPARACGSGTASENITERNYPTYSPLRLPEPPDQKLQLIDSI